MGRCEACGVPFGSTADRFGSSIHRSCLEQLLTAAEARRRAAFPQQRADK